MHNCVVYSNTSNRHIYDIYSVIYTSIYTLSHLKRRQNLNQFKCYIRMEYKKSRQNAKRVISSAKEGRRREWADDLNDSECQSEIFRRAGRMVGEGQDITGLDCVGGASGRVVVDDGGIRDCWRECMGRLMNEENEWDHKISAEVRKDQQIASGWQ